MKTKFKLLMLKKILSEDPFFKKQNEQPFGGEDTSSNTSPSTGHTWPTFMPRFTARSGKCCLLCLLLSAAPWSSAMGISASLLWLFLRYSRNLDISPFFLLSFSDTRPKVTVPGSKALWAPCCGAEMGKTRSLGKVCPLRVLFLVHPHRIAQKPTKDSLCTRSSLAPLEGRH